MTLKLKTLIIKSLREHGDLTLRELCCAVNGKPIDGSYCRSIRCRYVYYAGDHSEEFNAKLVKPTCTFNYLQVIRAVKALEDAGVIHTRRAYRDDKLSKWGMDRFTVVSLGKNPNATLTKFM